MKRIPTRSKRARTDDTDSEDRLKSSKKAKINPSAIIDLTEDGLSMKEVSSSPSHTAEHLSKQLVRVEVERTSSSTPNATVKHQAFYQRAAQRHGPKLAIYNDIDDTTLPGNFIFIDSNVLGDGVEKVDKDFLYGCECKSENGRHVGCEYTDCSCLQHAAPKDDGKRGFPYQSTGRNKDCLRRFVLNSRKHIFECNSQCNCGPECKNRVTQRGRQVGLEIFKTEDRGWGLRTLGALRQGQFVDYYLGEILTDAEATKRESNSEPGKESYLYVLDKFEDEEDFDEEHRYVIDGEFMSGPTRFMNHSCEPNCRQFTVSQDHADKYIYDLAFFALEDIPAGTELTFNYTDSEDPPVQDNEVERLNIENNKLATKCLCGTSQCRRYIWL